MAEELQHLIEKIQAEAVDQAEQKAKDIVSQARQQAATIVKEAEEKSAAIVKQAEQDSTVYTERSRKTLEQAARDLLITVGQGIERLMTRLVEESVDESLTVEVLQQMMVSMVEAYVKNDSTGSVELLVSEKDRDQLMQYFNQRFKEQLDKGLEIGADQEILKGFRVSLKDGQVYQDFTDEAIAEALSHFLRPHLAEIVSRVASEKESKPS